MGRRRKGEGSPESPYEARERMAREGDVSGLLDQMARTPKGLLDPRDLYEQVRRALDVSSRRDPDAFAQEVFRSMASFSAYTILRAQGACAEELAREDDRTRMHGMPLKVEVLEELLPSLHRLQTHLTTLLQNWASTARLWELARRHRTEGASEDKPAAKSFAGGEEQRLERSPLDRGPLDEALRREPPDGSVSREPFDVSSN